MKMGMVAALGAALMLGGCATVMRGTTELVVFESDPPNAYVHTMIEPACAQGCPGARTDSTHEVDEAKVGPSCITPCSLNVPRSQVLIATFSKEGYQPQTVRVGLKLAGAGAVGVAGNVVIGGAVGGFTDLATGAAQDHDPNPVKVALMPLAGEPKAKKR